MAKILVIDDEKSIRNTLREILEFENYQVAEASDGEEGLAKVLSEHFDVVLCDIKMPKLDGLEVLERAMEAGVESQFIMISAHGTIETAVDATKKGAFDFIVKPPDLNRLLLALRNALDKGKLVHETKTLRKKVAHKWNMVGESAAMLQVKETIEKVAPTDARVLIIGSNGTGKELVARSLHEKSNRSKGPMVEVNCAAIPSELIESELFGHEKGAFTSAVKQRIGKFEQANGGTLFLDEIGDMSLSAQAKVLRALQENRITRVGGDKDIQVDVRILAATNKDLRQMIAENKFREDLYHRLGVIVVRVPPLKERKEDIPMLVDRFLEDVAQEYGTAKKQITPAAITKLQEGDWTGNIRELRNVVERLVIMSGEAITEEDVVKYTEISL
ncbi:sigma-54-dependent transcriptional regulator [Cesiribacter andamanensis]|uniref:Transcriptional regulatory protein ZraR n=1 Tax=Cesiribacter andamanensis AMV16 TaxID=1279009 RepID=M7NIK4_9BACT|nr:sigma-54 dependent transcriptional regulator [Cesiribacter andamanensis]EMR01610.1 Transcriptional regulatory protein ZraR [Cesiribacter andamanensis AMV16]